LAGRAGISPSHLSKVISGVCGPSKSTALMIQRGMAELRAMQQEVKS
jgi:hypothetical protein